jgi:hypothetical protein
LHDEELYYKFALHLSMEKDEMDRACSMHEGDAKFWKNLSENVKRRDH